MKSKNKTRLSKVDKMKQEDIERRLTTEEVALGHPEGKERFEKVLRGFKKNS